MITWLELELAYDKVAVQQGSHKDSPFFTQSYWIWIICKQIYLANVGGGGSRGVMVKAIDCGIIVSEFEFHSHYNIHFRANTLGKGMNPLILPAMG